MSLFSPKPPIFGIDFSDLSMKIAQIEKRGNALILNTVGSKTFPEGLIKKGIIREEKEEELIKIIKSAISEVKGKKIKTKYAICSLPEEESFIKVIQIPKVEDTEIKEVVKWQIEPNFPVKLSEVYFDCQIVEAEDIPSEAKKIPVEVAVLRKGVVDSYLSVFKKAGIQPLAFEIESMSVIRSLIPNYFSSSPVIILDIGKCGSGLTIFSGKSILFTSHINIGGKDFTEAISRELKIEIEEAENLKKEIGMIGMEKKWKTYRIPVIGENNFAKEKSELSIDLLRKMKEEKIIDALIPILTDLVEQIRHYFEYFKNFGKVAYVPDGKIMKIILCGGEANLIGLTDFISSSLKLPAEKGNPLVNILPPAGVFRKWSPGDFLPHSTAIGLAIRGAQ